MGEDGKLIFRLPAVIFAGGKVPLRITKSLPGGEMDAVVESYPCDPYAPVNRITQVPRFVLARVSGVDVSSGIDVNSRVRDATRALGRRPKSDKLPDGSEWLQNDSAGLWVKHRDGGEAFKGDMIERIRLISRGAGSVAGISVGDDWGLLRTRLGEPEYEADGAASYLGHGLVFASASGTVASIDIARPRELLEQGTTAFVRRPRLRLYVRDFHGDPRCQVKTKADFRRYLSRMGAVQVIDREGTADYAISASTTFVDDKQVALDLIPYKYSAWTKLKYTLTDLSGSQVLKTDTIEGASKANYGKEAGLGAVVILLLERSKADRTVRRAIEAAIGTAGISAMKQSMGRAVRRCPAISEQATFNSLSDRLYALADFRAAVTGIDYQQGTIRISVGTADGVVASSKGQQASVFELFLGKPTSSRTFEEGGLSADYYVAEVVSTSDHACSARLRHVVRRVNKSREELSVTDAPDVVRQIPDPVTGIVSARMRVRFLPISGKVS